MHPEVYFAIQKKNYVLILDLFLHFVLQSGLTAVDIAASRKHDDIHHLLTTHITKQTATSSTNQAPTVTTNTRVTMVYKYYLFMMNKEMEIGFVSFVCHSLPFLWRKIHVCCRDVTFTSFFQGVREAIKNARKWAKQAFLRLEVRVLRPDREKTKLEPGVRGQEGEEGVRGKWRPHLPPEEDVREHYLSILTRQ